MKSDIHPFKKREAVPGKKRIPINCIFPDSNTVCAVANGPVIKPYLSNGWLRLKMRLTQPSGIILYKNGVPMAVLESAME